MIKWKQEFRILISGGMSVYGLSRTVVPHLLQQIVHHWWPTTSYCLWPPRSPGYSSLIVNYDRWSPVGPSLRGLVLNTCGESGSSAFSVRGRRTSSCKTTTYVRTTSRLGRIERFSENSFSRTASLKQPSLENNFSENNFSENNFSENNFSPTARTNCEDEPRIPSLRTSSPSSLRDRTCTSQKGFSTQIVRRKGSVVRHRYSAAYRVWSTLNKSSAGRVHKQYHGICLAKSIDTDFISACSHSDITFRHFGDITLYI